MGLLQAGIGALSGVLADQWREYFYCDSMPENVLMTKGVKRTGSRNANAKGEDNIITNGSIIAVNEGQCMMIVEQGAIVEFLCAGGRIRVGQFHRAFHILRQPWRQPQVHLGGIEEALHLRR